VLPALCEARLDVATMTRMGSKDMPQGMCFERDNLPITGFKYQSMTEKMHASCYNKIREMTFVQLKEIRDCRKAMCSAVVRIKFL
jgi:hypothetical protein